MLLGKGGTGLGRRFGNLGPALDTVHVNGHPECLKFYFGSARNCRLSMEDIDFGFVLLDKTTFLKRWQLLAKAKLCAAILCRSTLWEDFHDHEGGA